MDKFKETLRLLECANAQEQQQLLAEFFMGCRDRLKLMVEFRLDRRLQKRLDPSDVVQETFLDASRRLPAYLKNPRAPLFIWLRFLTGQKLLELHRHHLGTKARDPRREVALFDEQMPPPSSTAIAAKIAAVEVPPCHSTLLDERVQRLEEALERMNPTDREVLVLRHFEQLSSVEVSELLGLKPHSVRSRYLRALKRLKEILKKSAES
jgi:RNA polymerase sigma-70 factor (ECF subfamily)